jgi:hypothetical protein
MGKSCPLLFGDARKVLRYAIQDNEIIACAMHFGEA